MTTCHTHTRPYHAYMIYTDFSKYIQLSLPALKCIVKTLRAGAYALIKTAIITWGKKKQ